MKSLFVGTLTLVAASAFAQSPGLQLGQPIAGGTGCPAGTVQAVLSPDQTALSILFDSYQAEAGGSTRKTLDRKSCNVAVPIHVPQGFSVSVFNIDYRGYNSLPQGASSTFNVEYFFAGSVGPRFQQSFLGPLDDNYLINNQLVGTALVWSPCGADTNIRVNSSMVARTNGQREDTMATVDSADVQASLIYHLQWRTCR